MLPIVLNVVRFTNKFLDSIGDGSESPLRDLCAYALNWSSIGRRDNRVNKSN